MSKEEDLPYKSEDKILRSVTLQLVNIFQIKFTKCKECEGDGKGHTWIPICQKCYGVGRVIKELKLPKEGKYEVD